MKYERFLPVALGFALALAPSLLAAPAPKYNILHTFTGGKDGGGVATTPALDADGNLYGTTYSGGKIDEKWCPNGCGVVFRLAPEGAGKWKERVLLDFDLNTGGANWQMPLLFDGGGNLFGSTIALDYQHTYIFELTPGGGQWTFNPIYDSGGSGLVFDQAGNLYGVIPPGGIGELSPGSDGWTYTDLSDQTTASAPLSWDSQGNLYGTERYGGNKPPLCPGSAGCGTAFELTPNGDGTWTFHLLHRFAATQTDGYYPYGGLTVDVSGTAYGTTWAGGKYDTGTFFKLTPNKNGTWKETILYQFPNCADGCGPGDNLVADKSGNLYGDAVGGSTACGYTCGVIFKLSPLKNGKWKYSVLHKFNGKDGAFPHGVVLDSKGNIFGTTMQGGKYNMGVAFEITP